MRRRKPRTIKLPQADQRELKRFVSDGRTEQRMARRGQVLLAMKSPKTRVSELCQQVEMTRIGIWYMCRRYEITGLDAIYDAPGKANCTDCHNGPLYTNNDFHNTGVPVVDSLPEDTGRVLGAEQVMADEFNYLSVYSDAQPEQCTELRFLVLDEHQQERRSKPPSLRNVFNRGPFMHAGQLATLEEALNHYNSAPETPVGHSKLGPLNLSGKQISQIIAFLRTLDGSIDAELYWLEAP